MSGSIRRAVDGDRARIHEIRFAVKENILRDRTRSAEEQGGVIVRSSVDDASTGGRSPPPQVHHQQAEGTSRTWFRTSGIDHVGRWPRELDFRRRETTKQSHTFRELASTFAEDRHGAVGVVAVRGRRVATAASLENAGSSQDDEGTRGNFPHRRTTIASAATRRR